MIKEMYNITFRLLALDEKKYDMLIDFLEDNNIKYIESDIETYTIDTRSEQQKYDDWLSEQADNMYEEKALERINNE